MLWQFNLPAALLLAAGGLTLAIGWRSMRLPAFPGRVWFSRMQFAAAGWALMAALENLALLPETKVFWAELTWGTVMFCPTSWALFIWSYVHGVETRLSPPFRLLIVGMPLLTVAVALSNDVHHLLYLSTEPFDAEPGSPVNYVHGLWFFLALAYLYGFMLFSLVGISVAILRSHGIYRRHYLGFAAAMMLPWIANICYASGTLLLFGTDPTPFSFLFMGAVFFWLISRRQLFDLLPIARSALVDRLPDPVLVLDLDGMVVEANTAMQDLLGIGNPAGRSLGDLPLPHRALAPLLGLGTDMLRDISLNGRAERFEARRVGLDHHGRSVGMLLLFRDITRRCETEERLQTTLAQLEEQLEANIELQARLRDQATRDALTGLYNRRFFDEMRTALLADASSGDQSLAVVMVDLDHFKRLNDTWGHAAGDVVLRTVSGLFRRLARQQDLVFRMGGEELLLLLPGTTDQQAEACLERWRHEISGKDIAVPGGQVRVTFSAGVAAFPQDAEDWDSLIHNADVALYGAKQAGRDRTLRWSAMARHSASV